MSAPLSARHLRRPDAIERYLAGDPIETICREMGCSHSWLYKWTNRYVRGLHTTGRCQSHCGPVPQRQE
jgi:transposase-like protein